MNVFSGELKKVTNKDIPQIVAYLALSEYDESNHNVVNMFQWIHQYPLYIFTTNTYMLVFGIYEDEWYMMMPLCKEEHFKEAILKGEMIFKDGNQPFVLSCFCERQKDLALQVYPNLKVEEIRENADYIYLTEKLRTFSGKKLQKKRNHLNAFYAMYQDCYTYEKISMENIDACKAFLSVWKPEDNDDFLQLEKKGVLNVLDLLNELPYKGGIIKIKGQVKAFIIGSVLNDRMCQINIEKADDAYRGIYQAILQQFLLHEFLDKEFVNREDDVAKENLRKSKMAYQPVKILMMYKLFKG